MATRTTQLPKQKGSEASADVDPEVVAVAKRRQFSPAYKRQMVRAVAACKPGEVGALLRRERLYSSHLMLWRRELEALESGALSAKPPGPKPDLDKAKTGHIALEPLDADKRGRELEAVRIGDERDARDRRDPSPSRIAWARLLARVFAVDVSVCPKCRGAVRVVRAVTDPNEIAQLLHGARPPPLPSPPGQLGLRETARSPPDAMVTDSRIAARVTGLWLIGPRRASCA